ncbi:hypothetical protein AVEN_7876-1, partial [Araneus ventricosus]
HGAGEPFCGAAVIGRTTDVSVGIGIPWLRPCTWTAYGTVSLKCAGAKEECVRSSERETASMAL